MATIGMKHTEVLPQAYGAWSTTVECPVEFILNIERFEFRISLKFLALDFGFETYC